MYNHKRYSCKVLLSGPSQLEFLLISVYRNCHRINVGTFYRPPSSSVSIMDNVFSVLQGLDAFYFSNFLLLKIFTLIFVILFTPSAPNAPVSCTFFSLTQVASPKFNTQFQWWQGITV